MNAINLPVQCEDNGRSFQIRDHSGEFIAWGLSKEKASQIATALNMHDELVEALRFYSNPKKLPFQTSGHIAREVLAKIESANETNQA